MKLYTTLLALLTLTLLVACGETTPTSEDNVLVPDTTAQVTEPTPENTAKTDLPNKKIVEATFDHCTAYAAATDYYFKLLGSEDLLEFRVQDEESAEGPQVKVPADLLVATADGPPDTNPEKVGKLFRIVYDTEGKMIAVEPVE